MYIARCSNRRNREQDTITLAVVPGLSHSCTCIYMLSKCMQYTDSRSRMGEAQD